MPEGEKKIKVRIGLGGEEINETAKELKDYMCHNGYGHIIVNTKPVGLNDDNIDTLLGGANEFQLVKISCTEKKAIAIGEGIIYLNKHLNDPQKEKIRGQFKDKKLEDITELDLGSLDLEALPESFGDLNNLTHLHLGNNKLSSLPESFGNLEALEMLYLNDNKLTALPEAIEGFKNLMTLDSSNNPLSGSQGVSLTNDELSESPTPTLLPRSAWCCYEEPNIMSCNTQ